MKLVRLCRVMRRRWWCLLPVCGRYSILPVRHYLEIAGPQTSSGMYQMAEICGISCESPDANGRVDVKNSNDLEIYRKRRKCVYPRSCRPVRVKCVSRKPHLDCSKKSRLYRSGARTHSEEIEMEKKRKERSNRILAGVQYDWFQCHRLFSTF